MDTIRFGHAGEDVINHFETLLVFSHFTFLTVNAELSERSERSEARHDASTSLSLVTFVACVSCMVLYISSSSSNWLDLLTCATASGMKLSSTKLQ